MEKKYYCILEGESETNNPTVDFMSEKENLGASRTSIPEYVEWLLYFANMELPLDPLNKNQAMQTILSCFDVCNCIDTVDDYILLVNARLVEAVGESAASLILLDIENERKNDIQHFLNTPNEAKEYLTECLSNACGLAEKFAAILARYRSEGNPDRIASLISSMNAITSDIMFSIEPVFINGKLQFCNRYSACSIMRVILLSFLLSAKNKCIVGVCKVCGAYFSPAARKDEIYCERCRRITYDTKIKQNEAKSAYRSIYKTQNARKRRNQHIPGINDRFDRWKTEAKLVLQQCEIGEITVDDMKKRISATDWMSAK